MNSEVTVYYTFHPLHDRTLRTICRPRDLAVSVTVMDDAGHRLKIPAWMLSPEATHYQLSDQPIFAVSALQALLGLMEDVSDQDFETPK